MDRLSAGHEAGTLLAAHQHEIEEAMAAHFGGPKADPAPHRQAASDLLTLLLAALDARGVGTEGQSPPIAARRYQIQFGDGLAPVLRDVLGDAADASLIAICVDSFWREIRAREQPA